MCGRVSVAELAQSELAPVDEFLVRGGQTSQEFAKLTGVTDEERVLYL